LSGPIASIFWIDSELGSNVYLDGQLVARETVKGLTALFVCLGIITVVDAKFGMQVLN
jgi:hypothetical protein